MVYDSDLTINSIRIISAEAIEKAKSGHPGLPLGAAPIGYALFQNHLNYNPNNPNFFNRDRFILSAGHGSMLLYSLLHLYGFGVTMDDIKSFRTLGSLTPGHPEYRCTKGVETTTGPLGQGIANAVGMALAETYLANKFNRDGYNLIDHYTYALCGDGCMMEGIEYEAAALAGTLKLGKLIVLYDNNDITIDGNISATFKEDVGKRHEAQGWHVIRVTDGNDVSAIDKAVKKAKKVTDKPSLIIIKTHIGYGSPLEGSEKCHGAPLGADNLQKTKKNLNWNYPEFTIPDEVYEHTKKGISRAKRAESKWKRLLKEYKTAFPDLYKEFTDWTEDNLPDFLNCKSLWQFENKPTATRTYSGKVLTELSKLVPNLIGGSADLAQSNKSYIDGRGNFSAEDRSGANIYFGIREHSMSAVCNGIRLHGGLYPYCATFFIFSDYMKNAMRLSALMKLPVIYILSHDSIGVGEDGPTHQPIEQLVGLRSIPDMKVWRPCNGTETAAAYVNALTGTGPVSIVTSRQNLAYVESRKEDALKGGYVLKDCESGTPEVILIATGSEVSLALDAQKELTELNVETRVVSMPCMEIFDAQNDEYKEKVLPTDVRARIAIEAGSSYSWYKYVGLDGDTVTIDTFGTSAPYNVLFPHFGFTVKNVVEKALACLATISYDITQCDGECDGCERFECDGCNEK